MREIKLISSKIQSCYRTNNKHETTAYSKQKACFGTSFIYAKNGNPFIISSFIFNIQIEEKEENEYEQENKK